MKHIILTAALTLSSLALGSTWEFDASHSQANFSVKHFTITNVNGRLGNVSGKIELDDKDITRSKVDASVDMKGINSGVDKRDAHLRGPEWFDVEKYPTATFVSTKVEKVSDTKLKVSGDLTIHGVTKPVSLEADLSPEIKDPFSGATVRALTANTVIVRQDFNLMWKSSAAEAVKVAGDDVKVSIEGEIRKKEGPPAKTTAAAPAKK